LSRRCGNCSHAEHQLIQDAPRLEGVSSGGFKAQTASGSSSTRFGKRDGPISSCRAGDIVQAYLLHGWQSPMAIGSDRCRRADMADLSSCGMWL
jgi:hypothetical protein